ncbi:hypothetical protein RhiirA4_523140, partial [Rhizophagus irregularis]
TPTNILEQLNEIIKHEDILNITARKLLTGKILKMYLNNTASINDLHISLNNSSKLNYYIKKQKRLEYPHGSDLMGVIHELLRQQNKDDSYIRNVLINNSSIKEWEITSYVEKINKSLTFARVFTNVETSNAYKHIFYEVFSTIEKDNGKKIEFSYLNSNSNGIGCIITKFPGRDKMNQTEVIIKLSIPSITTAEVTEKPEQKKDANFECTIM